MPPLLTSIGAFKQNCTGSAFASDSLAATSGDALTPINYVDGSTCHVEEIWSGNSAHKCEFAFFGNRFGDPILGLRLEHQFNPTLSGADGEPQLLLPAVVDVPWYRGDTMTIQTLCSGSDNVDVVLQLYYSNVEGSKQRLTSWELIQANIERFISIELTVTPGTTGNYGTAVAINTNDDRLVGDDDYAILGITTDQPVLSIGVKGPDTGQYRVAVPGHWNERVSSGWFVDQDARRPTPHIPVINALNKATTFVDGLSASNAGATKVTFFLAQLRNRITT